MEVQIINKSEVGRLLPMTDCIKAVGDALAALARGEGVQPLRTGMWLPERAGVLGAMPGYLSNIGAFGIKVISVFPGSGDSHKGAVLLFDSEDGRLLAVIDAGEITAIRTAAASAVATDLLARRDVSRLTILGSGVQAASHLSAMLLVRPFTHVRVWSRTGKNAERFAERESRTRGIEIEAVSDVEAAVAGADVICTTTGSTKPVLPGALLSEGMHVNAVGASVPKFRELDTEAVVKSRFYVDSRESARNECGALIAAMNEGAVGDSHIIGEVGEVLAGLRPGRGSDDEITIFKSMGLAVEDLAAAHLVYQRAAAEGLGTLVDL
jgi:ornithine cyclodeaminase